MKKFLFYVLSFVIVLSMAACSKAPAEGEVAVGTEPHSEDTSVQIPNPWQKCDTLQDAQALAGFSFRVPDSVDGYSGTSISAVANEMIEVEFCSDDSAEASLCFRKGIGTENISGDYNTYERTEELTVGDKTVTCKGSGDLYNTIFWTDGSYCYAVLSTAGMSEEQVNDWVLSLA